MLRFMIAALTGLALASNAEASKMLRPAASATDMGNALGTSTTNLHNGSGLSASFSSLVTEAAPYLAANPTHNSLAVSHIWLSATCTTGGCVPTGIVVFNLGGLRTIDSLVLWNGQPSSTTALVGFTLIADDNVAFSSPTVLGSFTAAPTGASNAVNHQQFNFTTTVATHVRMMITSNQGANQTMLGEVAFTTPELVNNGGFEGGQFVGFNTWNPEAAAVGSDFRVTRASPHFGFSCAFFGASGGLDDQISQVVGTSPGNRYKISFWVNNSISGGDHLAVFWESNSILQQLPCAQPLDVWSQITLYANAAAPVGEGGARGAGSELRFALFDGPGSILLDDVSVLPVPCPGDLQGSGSVNVSDLLALIGAWGPNPGHAADLNGDGSVNVSDLLILINEWGPC